MLKFQVMIRLKLYWRIRSIILWQISVQKVKVGVGKHPSIDHNKTPVYN